MKITYDPIADAMYVCLAKKKKPTRTEVLRDDLIVDLYHNNIIGIEILDVSKKLPKKELNNINLIIPTYSAEKLAVNR